MKKKVLSLLTVIACLCFPTTSVGQILTDFYSYEYLASGGCRVYLKVNFLTELNKAEGGVYTSDGYTWKTGDPLPNPAPNGMYNGSAVTSMYTLFYGCNELTSLDLSKFDTSNVTTMNDMFYGCTKLTSLDLSSFDTSKVTDMANMFWDCNKLTNLNISKFDTSNVTTMANMFCRCFELKSLDISNFDTSKVTNMESMFVYCKSLDSLNLSNFNTNIVYNAKNMFYGCEKLKSLDLSNFNTQNMECMKEMFVNCKALSKLDLSNFNTSKVTDIANMFSVCGSNDGSGQAAIGIVKDWDTAYKFNNKYNTSIDTSKLKFGVANKYNNLDYVIFQDSNGSNKSATLVASKTDNYAGTVAIASNVEVGTDKFPVKAVAIESFKDCSNLSDVELPMSIAKVGDYAFVGAPASISLNMLAGTPPAVSGLAFDDAHYASATLTVPGAAKTAYIAHNVWSKFINMPSGIDSANKDNSDNNVARIPNGVIVSGIEAGETVKLYSGDGALIRSVKASESSVTIDGVQSGMYIVTVGAKAVKVVI